MKIIYIEQLFRLFDKKVIVRVRIFEEQNVFLDPSIRRLDSRHNRR